MTYPRTRLAAYAVAVDHDTILLTRIAAGFPGEGRWTLPGGGVHWGEDPRDALIREVFEETGLTVTGASLLDVDSRTYEASGTFAAIHAVRILYEVPLDGTPRVTESGGSVDDTAWVPFDELDGLDLVDLVRVGLDALRS